MNQRKTLYLLLITAFLVRLFTVVFINKIPCMEGDYLTLGAKLFTGEKTIIGLSPFYSLVVYITTVVFGSLKMASVVIYTFGSFAIVFFLEKITRLLFNERAALIVLLLAIFLPNLTTAVAGYSHSVVLSNAFEFAAIYYLFQFFTTDKIKFLLVTAFLSLVCIAIRPENVVILSILFALTSFYIVVIRKKQSYLTILRNGSIYYAIIGLFVIGHQHYVTNHSSADAHPGTFSDNTYSYGTFIDTYSLRYDEKIVRPLSISESTPRIGSPADNDYKISKAILKHPKEFIGNMFFNINFLVKTIGHILFVPFFLYFFMGIMLLNADNLEKYKWSIIGVLGLLAIHLIPLLAFHIEIRYTQQLCLLFLILIAYNFSLLTGKIYKVCITATIITLFVIYIQYAFMNHHMTSLCG